MTYHAFSIFFSELEYLLSSAKVKNTSTTSAAIDITAANNTPVTDSIRRLIDLAKMVVNEASYFALNDLVISAIELIISKVFVVVRG